MAPPLRTGPYAALSTWSQEAEYDTAAECDDSREALITEPPPQEFTGWKKALYTKWVAASKCIASDDPRLRGK